MEALISYKPDQGFSIFIELAEQFNQVYGHNQHQI